MIDYFVPSDASRSHLDGFARFGMVKYVIDAQSHRVESWAYTRHHLEASPSRRTVFISKVRLDLKVQHDYY